ncbi:MAG: amidohydrolase family protein, partial [Coprothermobacterota bacterium]|nr:amidohydrolase family protein [Coprothermobacterota bacterium]
MAEQRATELLIHSGIIVTMNPEHLIIENGALAIDQGRITELGDSETLRSQYKGKKEIDATHKIVMPGLVNLHFHADNFSRGVGEHLGLEEWIDTIYYPMLAAMTPDDAYKTAMLAYSEVIKGGTTTVNDMYIKLPSLADAAEKTGIRAVLSSEGADLIPGQETLEDNEKAFLERNNTAGGRILVVFGIEWIPVCSAEYIKKCRSLADKYGVGVHVHLNESKGEVQLCKEKYGKPPVEFVND